MDLASIKDPKLRQRIEEADARQNGVDRAALTKAAAKAEGVPHMVKGKRGRLRQSAKPLMNKLESEFYETIRAAFPNYPPVRIQAKRYRLGNGIWYKPDFTAAAWPAEEPDPLGHSRETAWEVKGPKSFRGGFENLKVAASLYPEVRWLLVWKDKESGEWKEQHILP